MSTVLNKTCQLRDDFTMYVRCAVTVEHMQKRKYILPCVLLHWKGCWYLSNFSLYASNTVKINITTLAMNLHSYSQPCYKNYIIIQSKKFTHKQLSYYHMVDYTVYDKYLREKLLWFVNNIHYVGKTFTICLQPSISVFQLQKRKIFSHKTFTVSENPEDS